MKLESMALEMPEVKRHPNRAEFRGVLTTVDLPSQRSPSGAKGHLVVLTKRAAQQALPSLLGMALDYSPTFDRHDVCRKVGVITRAEIVGRDLEIGGHLFAKDFPEIVSELGKKRAPAREARFGWDAAVCQGSWVETHKLASSLRATADKLHTLAINLLPSSLHRDGHCFYGKIRAESLESSSPDSSLGLSYEVTDVMLSDSRSQIWILEKVTFTGAAILRRDKAAYRHTWIKLCAPES